MADRSDDEHPHRGWVARDLLRAIALFFAVLIVLRLLWIAHHVLLITALALLFGIALARGVDILERHHIKRPIGAVILMALILGSVVGIGALITPKLREQSDEMRERLPAVIDRIEQRLGGQSLATTLSQSGMGGQQQTQQREPQQKDPQQQKQPPQQSQQQPQKKAPLKDTIGSHAGLLGKMLFPFVTNTVAAVGGLVIIIFLTLYFAIDPELYRNGLLRLVPPRSRGRADSLLRELAELLHQWVVARSIAMVVIGVITAGALMAIGVPAAAALGLLAGLLELIPFFGPIVAAIPAVGMALVVSPSKAMTVVVIFIVIQQLEGNVLTPLLMKNRLDVPPAITVIAVTAMGAVFGVIGMLLAEPLSAAAILITRRLYVERIEGKSELSS